MAGEQVGPSAAVIPVSSESWSADHLYIHLSGKIEDLKGSLGDLRQADAKAIDAALAAQEKAVATALVAAEKAVITALASAEKAVSAALAAQEKATDKYEREVERWRANSNEWRSAMDDRETKFVQAETFDARLSAVAAMIENQRVTTEIGLADLRRSRDLAVGRQTAATALIGLIFAAITIALRFI